MFSRRTFLLNMALLAGGLLNAGRLGAFYKKKRGMKVRLLRNATLVVEVAGKKILVDPMLGKKDSMKPIEMASNAIRIPMVELPLTEQELRGLVQSIDAVMLTHMHRDHWDEAARNLLPKDILLFCQPEDAGKLREQGFTNLQPVADHVEWQRIAIHRTGGQHGTGEIGKMMAPVSGFVLDDGQRKLYIAGDTIWCEEVADVLDTYRPDWVVVNSGAAQFLQGDPITMTAADVITTAKHSPAAKLFAVHMETINHCYLTRAGLKQAVSAAGLDARVNVPADGEWFIG
ncbi:MBL fold metallo-hydrolase [Flavihumibacter rivuli]|uniref:MBL fold metallo-hydrolase n=1 Tax=Flavihumibacter rivuli TaxID=2838156 RepID=UPI001BDF4895|nr:MBL fold metallo-hydrolase [Flavihumibacter rivuli]ULQ55182.1 MBL fold metallo-hydrolase [Flavihumibacter rivuli]